MYRGEVQLAAVHLQPSAHPVVVAVQPAAEVVGAPAAEAAEAEARLAGAAAAAALVAAAAEVAVAEVRHRPGAGGRSTHMYQCSNHLQHLS